MLDSFNATKDFNGQSELCAGDHDEASLSVQPSKRWRD